MYPEFEASTSIPKVRVYLQGTFPAPVLVFVVLGITWSVSMDLQPKDPFANALQQVDVVRSEPTLFYNV